jgi:uncharacterized glyoxalase superfamily protein PhnB
VLRYTDAPAAIRFLTDALGFTEVLVVPGEADGVVAHAELSWPPGGGVMLGSRDQRAPTHLPSGSASVCAVTDEPDALFDRAVAAGAEVVQDLLDEQHGRGFTVRDPEGNLWSFGTYRGASQPETAPRDTAGIRRAMPHVASERFDESRDFYVGFLGFTEAMDMGRIVTFVSPTNPTAQVSIVAHDRSSPVQPHVTVEVGDVDAVHAEAVRRGLQVVYPLTDEPWGVRRFFVVDPNGAVLNVMSHR